MSKNVKIAGALFNDVPAINIPLQSGGNATFYDCEGSMEITKNGTFDVTGLASAIVNVVPLASAGSSLPSGIKAIDFGKVTVSSSSEVKVSHSLGEAPDLVMVWANGNIAATNQMLMSVRSSQIAYRSSAYACFCMYHGNSTTTVSTANTNSGTSGVCNFTASQFSLRTYSNYYWSNGTARTFNWIALKFA